MSPRAAILKTKRSILLFTDSANCVSSTLSFTPKTYFYLVCLSVANPETLERKLFWRIPCSEILLSFLIGNMSMRVCYQCLLDLADVIALDP